MTSLQCGSGFGLLRLGLLLIGLLLPVAAGAVVESGILSGSETKVAGKDATECIPVAGKRRSCQPCRSHRRISSAERTILSACPLDRRGMSGNRFSNGLLAPMRC